LFLPLAEDEEITGMSRGTGGDGAEHDIISEFIGKSTKENLQSFSFQIVFFSISVHCHAQPSEKK